MTGTDRIKIYGFDASTAQAKIQKDQLPFCGACYGNNAALRVRGEGSGNVPLGRDRDAPRL